MAGQSDGQRIKWNTGEFHRWAKSPRYSSLIDVAGHHIIVLKTPLMSRFESRFAESAVFTTQMFVERMAAKRLRVGMVIDATQCSAGTFYSTADWEDWDIDVSRVGIDSKGEIARDDVVSNGAVDDAVRLCEDVWAREPNSVVAILSIDGYNTAGVVAIAVLVDVAKLSLLEAVTKFAQARPPGVFLDAHRKVLTTRYDAASLEAVTAPDHFCDLLDPKPMEHAEPSPKKRIRAAHLSLDLSVVAPETGNLTKLCGLTTSTPPPANLPSAFVSEPGAYEKRLDLVANLPAFRFDLVDSTDPKQISKLRGFLDYLQTRRKAARLAMQPCAWYLEPNALQKVGSNAEQLLLRCGSIFHTSDVGQKKTSAASGTATSLHTPSG